MTLSDYLSQARGRISELAKVLDVSPAFVSSMAAGKKAVPVDHCISIEKWTARVVLCEDLRSDVDWGYIRSAPLPPQRSTTP